MRLTSSDFMLFRSLLLTITRGTITPAIERFPFGWCARKRIRQLSQRDTLSVVCQAAFTNDCAWPLRSLTSGLDCGDANRLASYAARDLNLLTSEVSRFLLASLIELIDTLMIAIRQDKFAALLHAH